MSNTTYGDAVAERQESCWTELVEKIQRDDPAGMEELYRVFSRGIRFYLCRVLGPRDLDDKVHDAFLVVTQAIRRGDLREPERLMGYVRTVVRRQAAAHIEEAMQCRRQQTDFDAGLPVPDRGETPEQAVVAGEMQDIARRVLKGICQRDREILIRFYLEEQSADQICREMNLTDTQFRLLKSRAKARFTELGRRWLSRRRGFPFS